MNEQTKKITRRTFVGASSLAALSLPLNTSLALAETSAEKQAEADAALASLNAMEEKLDAAEVSYHAAVSEQEAAQAKMSEVQARIDEIQAQLTQLQGNLSTRARSMYRSGSSTLLDFLLGATSFAEFTQNWNLLEQINNNDQNMIQQSKDLKVEAQAQKEEYEAQEKLASEKAAEALSIKQEAEATVASMQETYNNLSAEAAQLLAEEQAAAEAEAARLAEEEAARQAAASASSSSSSNSGSSSSSSSSNGTAPSYGGSDPYERAVNYLGNATYKWGECSPGLFDCSGFVSYCLTGEYSRIGSTKEFMNWPTPDDPQPGDVYTNNSHCGIYESPGQMIHCSSTYQTVVRGPARNYEGSMKVVRRP